VFENVIGEPSQALQLIFENAKPKDQPEKTNK
jgi:hypothetical protein